MIKIERADCPTVLKDTPSVGTRYNRKAVVKVLWEMQHGKCCYCEQKIPTEGHSKAVDHFQPQSQFNFLRNDWRNLLLACAQCNGKKSNKFPLMLTDNDNEAKVLFIKTSSRVRILLIDPSHPDVDPEDHIRFDFAGLDSTEDEFGIIMAKNNSDLGNETIKTVGLSNNHYHKKRHSLYLEIIMPFYTTLLQTHFQGNDPLLGTAKTQFRLLMSAKHEFASYARDFARSKKLNEPPFALHIPNGSEI